MLLTLPYSILLLWASLLAQMLPAMWETQVLSLDQEDPLEKGTATHSSILAIQCSCLEDPRDREAWWAAIYGSHRVALKHGSH